MPKGKVKPMNDQQLIAQVNDYLDRDAAISLSELADGLRAYRRENERLQKREQQEQSQAWWAREGLISRLQQEVEQCNEEYQTHMSDMQSVVDRLQQERDKAIEGLRWYADAENYKLKNPDDYDMGAFADYHVMGDNGGKARSILSELGVNK